MCESSEFGSSNKVFEFGYGCGHAARDFVTTNAREEDPVSFGLHAGCEFVSRFCGASNITAGSGGEAVAFELSHEVFLFANIDVATSATAFFFYLCEIGSFVPTRLRVVVIGDSIEPGSFDGSAGD